MLSKVPVLSVSIVSYNMKIRKLSREMNDTISNKKLLKWRGTEPFTALNVKHLIC